MTVAGEVITAERTRRALEELGVWQMAAGEIGWPGREVRFPCPIHGGTRKDAFKLQPDGLWHCFTGCREGGGILALIGRMRGCSHEDARSFYLGEDAHKPAARISTHSISHGAPRSPLAGRTRRRPGVTDTGQLVQSSPTRQGGRGPRPGDPKPAHYPYRTANSPLSPPVWVKCIERGHPEKKNRGWGVLVDGRFTSRRGAPPRYWYTHALERFVDLLPADGGGVRVCLAAGGRTPQDKRLWVVEGEQCADLLGEAGLCATTGANGAGSFSSGMSAAMLAFLRQWPEGIVILPDADDAGESYAQAVASAAHAAGLPVCVARLPGLNDGEDVVGWAWREGHLPDHGFRQDGSRPNGEAILLGLLEAAAVAEAWSPPPEESPRRRLRFISSADLAGMKSEKPRHTFETRGGEPVIGSGLILLYGAPKMGKSFCAMELSYSIASGHPAFGLLYPAGPPGGVLYINADLQENGDLSQRQADMLEGRPCPDMWSLSDLEDGESAIPKDEALLAEVLAEVRARGDVRLVVIDTLTAATGAPSRRGDLQSQDMESVLRWKALAKEGVTVILMKHSPKMLYQDAGANVAGSNGILAAVDQAIYLERKRDAKTATLMALGGRATKGAAITLEAKESGGFRGLAVSFGTTADGVDARQRVLDLAGAHSQGVSADMVAAELERSKDAARQLLQRMAKDGLLNNTSRGWYAPSGRDSRH